MHVLFEPKRMFFKWRKVIIPTSLPLSYGHFTILVLWKINVSDRIIGLYHVFMQEENWSIRISQTGW